MKIIIKATDSMGETQFFHKFASLECARKAFEGLSYDPANQDVNWFLFVDGEELDWHCPMNKVGTRN